MENFSIPSMAEAVPAMAPPRGAITSTAEFGAMKPIQAMVKNRATDNPVTPPKSVCSPQPFSPGAGLAGWGG